MTLSTTVNTKTYTGDASTTAFSFPYLFYANADLTVTVDGTAQVLDTDYTVSGAGVGSGGTVTFTTAPASAAAIVIQRIVDYTQDTDFENFDGNPADVTEKQFDLVIMQAQQLSEQTDRIILTPIGTSLTTNTISGTIDTTARVLTITTSGPATATLGSLSTSIDTVFTSLATNDYLQYNGTNWVNVSSLNFNVVEDTTPQLGGTLDTNAKQVRWSKGADVASASALTLGTDGNYFDITGTTTVTSIATLAAGTVVKLHFDGILTLTHHATDLILPGGANITTAAGDEAEFVEYASGDWRCTNYTRASGEAVTASGGLFPQSQQPSGRYMVPVGYTVSDTSTGLAVAANRHYYYIMKADQAVTLDEVALSFVISGTSNFRMGLYEVEDGLPTDIILDAGTGSFSTSGTKSIAISQAISAGTWYAVTCVFDATPTVACANAAAVDSLEGILGQAFGSNQAYSVLGSVTSFGGYASHTYGALPSTFGSPTLISNPTQLPTLATARA